MAEGMSRKEKRYGKSEGPKDGTPSEGSTSMDHEETRKAAEKTASGKSAPHADKEHEGKETGRGGQGVNHGHAKEVDGMHTRHEHARREMHTRHEREQRDLHERHEGEIKESGHKPEVREKHRGAREEMHGRHEREHREMHSHHEREHREMMSDHAGEVGGDEGPAEHQAAATAGKGQRWKTSDKGTKGTEPSA